MRSNGPLLVSADPVLLAQALSNLIDNALKYAPHGGSIEVAVHSCDDLRAEISVSDNGPGIDDAEKTKVMQRFYRGDASRGTPGVGLGLSLVQAVAKLHGSALELLDNGPGLRVLMTVPIDAASTSSREVQPQASPASDEVAPPTLASLP
jgi:signal transduction histidine kinase